MSTNIANHCGQFHCCIYDARPSCGAHFKSERNTVYVILPLITLLAHTGRSHERTEYPQHSTSNLELSSSAWSSIVNTTLKLSMVVGNIGAHLHGVASRVKTTAGFVVTVFCNIGALFAWCGMVCKSLVALRGNV